MLCIENEFLGSRKGRLNTEALSVCRCTLWTIRMLSTVSTAPTRPSWRTQWWRGWLSRSLRSVPPWRSTLQSDTEGEKQWAHISDKSGLGGIFADFVRQLDRSGFDLSDPATEQDQESSGALKVSVILETSGYLKNTLKKANVTVWLNQLLFLKNFNPRQSLFHLPPWLYVFYFLHSPLLVFLAFTLLCVYQHMPPAGLSICTSIHLSLDLSVSTRTTPPWLSSFRTNWTPTRPTTPLWERWVLRKSEFSDPACCQMHFKKQLSLVETILIT